MNDTPKQLLLKAAQQVDLALNNIHAWDYEQANERLKTVKKLGSKAFAVADKYTKKHPATTRMDTCYERLHSV